MPWFKVDDKLHDHRKARKAGKAAIGVWVLAGSWAMDNLTDGFIPDDVLTRWGTRADAGRLVAAGLWYVDEHNGERGWRFHDWTHFQPSAAVTAATKAKEAEAGLRGNHNRWHVQRGITDPDCAYCYRVPDQDPDGEPDRVDVGSGRIGGESPVPVPDPIPHVSPNGETSRRRDLEPVDPPREDVERICDHLARRIEANGAKRPTVTTKWHDSARLLIDRDGRTEQQVHAAIEWCQADEFWRANILSLPKLREKFDQLRLQAQRRTGISRRQDETDQLFERALTRAQEGER